MKLMLGLLFLTQLSVAQADNYYLSAEDQKYFKNESGMGKNTMERVDNNVKEINKLHGEIAGLKNEIALLKEEIQKLKSQAGAAAKQD